MRQLKSIIIYSLASSIKLPIFLLPVFLMNCSNLKEKSKWTYSPYSESVIRFEIINAPPSTYFINTMYQTLVPRDFYESDPIKITKGGIYYKNIIIDRPLAVKLNFGEESYSVFLFPDDTSTMEASFSDEGYTITFKGSTSSINTYYLEKELKFGNIKAQKQYNFLINTEYEYPKIKKLIDSVTREELNYLRNYKASPKFSKKFIKLEEAEITYESEIIKLDLPNSGRFTGNRPDVLDTYFDYLDHLNIDNNDASFSPNYFWFIDQYFRIKYDIEYLRQLSRSEAAKNSGMKKINIAHDKLSGFNGDVYKLSSFCSFLPYYKNDLAIDSITEKLNLSEYHQLIKKVKTSIDEKNGLAQLSAGDIVPEFYVSDINYDLLSIRLFEDFVVLMRFYQLEKEESKKNESIPADFLNNLGEKVKLLNICIDCELQEWLEAHAKENSYLTNVIAEFNWNEVLKKTYKLDSEDTFILLDSGNKYVANFKSLSSELKSKIDAMLVTL